MGHLGHSDIYLFFLNDELTGSREISLGHTSGTSGTFGTSWTKFLNLSIPIHLVLINVDVPSLGHTVLDSLGHVYYVFKP